MFLVNIDVVVELDVYYVDVFVCILLINGVDYVVMF